MGKNSPQYAPYPALISRRFRPRKKVRLIKRAAVPRITDENAPSKSKPMLRC